MVNQFQLTAILLEVSILRYTPAGVPVLDVLLEHHSIQEENDKQRTIKFTLPAKILGQSAIWWQHQKGALVLVSGFIAQRNIKTFSPLLHISNIQEYKG